MCANENHFKKGESLELQIGFCYTCVMFLVLATELGGRPLLTDIKEPCRLLLAIPSVPEELLSLLPLVLGTLILLLFLRYSFSLVFMVASGW